MDDTVVAVAPIDPDVLEHLVLSGVAQLRRISASKVGKPTKPGEWTALELLGHLIDSALNNHQRLIRAQITEHLDETGTLRFPGYEQTGWVTAGAYASRKWSDLIDLWVAINSQIVHVLRNFPADAAGVPISLDGQSPVPMSEAFDYTDHLHHHLADFPAGEARALGVLPDTITAEGLELRLPLASDRAAVIAAVQDPEIPKWSTEPSPYGDDEWTEFLNRANRWQRADELRRNYLVTEHGELVGMVGLVRVNEADLSGEVGYWVSGNARRRAIATRALQALLPQILAAGYQRISAEIIVGNDASEGVLLRSGFTKEGRFRSVGSHGCGDAQTRIDVDSFRLLPSDPSAQQFN